MNYKIEFKVIIMDEIKNKISEANKKADDLIIRAAYKNIPGINFICKSFSPEELKNSELAKATEGIVQLKKQKPFVR